MKISNNNKPSRKVGILLMLCLMPFLLSACIFNETVEASQAGIRVSGGKVSEVIGASGPYFNLSPNESLVKINVSSQTIPWENPSLATKDKQPIGLELSVDYRRNRDAESLTNMYSFFNAEAISDASLIAYVTPKIASAAKNATSFFTLNQMIGSTEILSEEDQLAITSDLGLETGSITSAGRDTLGQVIMALLQRELVDIGVTVVSVSVSEVTPSEEYRALMGRTSNAQQEQVALREENKTKQQLLINAQADTDIALEVAERERQVREIEATVYSNPASLEIRLAEIFANAINEADTIVYIPQGSDLVSVLSGADGILPIDAAQNVPATEVPAGQ